MIDFFLNILYCLPLALQLSGALVLISAMRSIDQVIKSLLSPSATITAVFDSNKKNLKLDPKKVQSALENNYYQKFAMWYIIAGYLSAVLFADHSPSGTTDTIIVTICTLTLLLIAILVAKYLSRKIAPQYATYPADQAPEGTIAYDPQN